MQELLWKLTIFKSVQIFSNIKHQHGFRVIQIQNVWKIPELYIFKILSISFLFVTVHNTSTLIK